MAWALPMGFCAGLRRCRAEKIVQAIACATRISLSVWAIAHRVFKAFSIQIEIREILLVHI